MSEAYDDAVARPEFYVGGFDPRSFLRLNTDEEGHKEWTLDVKHKKLWFRLVYPNGRISTQALVKDERRAYIKARVYASKDDPPENYLAEGTAERFAPTDPDPKSYELYYADWAETVAIGRALTNAGFDVPFVNITQDGLLLDPFTGEVIDGQAPGGPAPAAQPQQEAQSPAPPRQYSDRTAPPAVQQTPPAPQTAPAVRQPAARKAGMVQQPMLPPAAQQAPASAGASVPVQQTFQAVPAQQMSPAQAVPAQSQPPAIIEPQTEEEALKMPLGWAKNYKVTVGMYRGQRLGDVAMQGRDKIEWYLTGYKGTDFKLRAAARILLDRAMAQAG